MLKPQRYVLLREEQEEHQIYLAHRSDSSCGTDIPPSRDVHTMEVILER
jgi:hypothetical protein